MRAAKALREARARADGAATAAPMYSPPRLHRKDFLEVYSQELAQGKFWGIEHDLRVVNGRGLAAKDAAPFTARFDYLYYTPGALRLTHVLPPLSDAQYASLLSPGGEILPNAWFPSDHLPVAAALELLPPVPER